MPPIIPNFWKEEILPADTNGDFLGLRQHLAGAEEESWDNGQCEVMSLDHEGEGRQGGEAASQLAGVNINLRKLALPLSHTWICQLISHV